MRKPDNTTKAVAKSLHTVTVLYQVAGLIRATHELNDIEGALDAAMVTLELANRPDPYGLRARALAELLKDAA
jgi:hypothetical protein